MQQPESPPHPSHPLSSSPSSPPSPSPSSPSSPTSSTSSTLPPPATLSRSNTNTSPLLKASTSSLASSTSSYERKELAPPLKFKKAELNDDLRAIFNIESDSEQDPDFQPGKFSSKILQENSSTRLELSYKVDDDNGKGKAKIDPALTGSASGTDEASSSTYSVKKENTSSQDAGSSSKKPPLESNISTSSMDVHASDYFPSPPGTPSTRPTSPSLSSSGSSENLLPKPKKKNPITELTTRFFEKPEEPPILMEKPKQKKLQFSPPVHPSIKYSRKTFDKVESYTVVKDKKYRSVLDQQEQRILTEVPRMISLQIIEEAGVFDGVDIKNLGEKHEITITAMERLNLMAKELGRECEFPLEDE